MFRFNSHILIGLSTLVLLFASSSRSIGGNEASALKNLSKQESNGIVGATPGQLPHHDLKMVRDEEGNLYIHPSMPLYVSVSTAVDGKQELLKVGENVDPSFKVEGNGVHHIKHSEGGHANIYELNADGESPETSAKFSGAKSFKKDSVQYYGKGLSVELSPKDEMSGLEKLYTAIDGAGFQEGDSTLQFSQEKDYVLRFGAVDKVGNTEKVNIRRFVVDTTAPEVKHQLTGPYLENQISPQTTVQLFAKDELSGVKGIFYKFDNEDFKPYVGKEIPLNQLSEGSHTLYYYTQDRVDNKSEIKSFAIYFDRTTPDVSFEVEGDRNATSGNDYVSSRTRIKLGAKDNRVGIHKIEYEINGQGFQTYNSPFGLPLRTGRHTIKFRAFDDLMNLSKADAKTFFIDLEQPRTNHSFDGPTFLMRDTLFITTRTFVRLPAQDTNAGVKKSMYELDGSPINQFSKPFVVEGRGFHEVYYHSFDKVNNREARKRIAFVVDDGSPQLFHHFSAAPFENLRHNGKNIGVYPKLTKIFLAATDDISGTKTIWYSLNNGPEKVFIDPIGNLPQGTYTLKYRAQDNVTNESRGQITFAIGRF